MFIYQCLCPVAKLISMEIDPFGRMIERNHSQPFSLVDFKRPNHQTNNWNSKIIFDIILIRIGTFFECNSLLRFVLLGKGFPSLTQFFFSRVCSLLLSFSFDVSVLKYLHYIKGWKSSLINKPDNIQCPFIFVTIWHKRIINNSICLIRNICFSHYLDLSSADIFPLFIGFSFTSSLL